MNSVIDSNSNNNNSNNSNNNSNSNNSNSNNNNSNKVGSDVWRSDDFGLTWAEVQQTKQHVTCNS